MLSLQSAKVLTRTGGLGNNRMSRSHPNYSIVEIGQNTEKSPGDMRRLAVTQSANEKQWTTSNFSQKKEKELETLIHTVRIYSQDIGMEFGIEKCAMLVMKSGKRQLTDGMELPNKDKIKTLAENETYQYLGTLEADTIKQAKMKEKKSERISQN